LIPYNPVVQIDNLKCDINNCIGSFKFTNNNYCSNCLIKIGDFQNTQTNDKFSLVNSSKFSCINWIQLNPYKNLPVRFLTTGHINVKTDLNNYGKMNIRQNYYLMKN
jgi:hypothetical protein